MKRWRGELWVCPIRSPPCPLLWGPRGLRLRLCRLAPVPVLPVLLRLRRSLLFVSPSAGFPAAQFCGLTAEFSGRCGAAAGQSQAPGDQARAGPFAGRGFRSTSWNECRSQAGSEGGARSISGRVKLQRLDLAAGPPTAPGWSPGQEWADSGALAAGPSTAPGWGPGQEWAGRGQTLA